MPIIPGKQTKHYYKFKVDSLNCAADLAFGDRVVVVIDHDGIGEHYQFFDGVLENKRAHSSDGRDIVITDEMMETCYYITRELRYYMEQRKAPAGSKQAARIDFILTHLPL